MPRRVPAGCDESNARKQFSIPVNLAIPQRWMIPMLSGRGKSRMSTPRDLILFTLYDELSLREQVMCADMVAIEVRANYYINPFGGQP
jgi:hypothetical protein